MKKVEAELLRAESYSDWDYFVDECELGTLFHKSGWLIKRPGTTNIWVVKKEERIIGGFAGNVSKRFGVSGYFIPAYTPYYHPLITQDLSNSEQIEVLSAILLRISTEPHVDIRIKPQNGNFLPYQWAGYNLQLKATHLVEGDFENYLKDLNKNRLREIKKLEKQLEEGELKISESGNKDEIEELFKLTESRGGYDGKISEFESIRNHTQEKLEYFVHSKSHGPVAYGFFPYDDSCLYNLINISLRVKDPILKTINLLLVYKAIDFALNSSRSFDFEGSSIQGIERFYRLMGGQYQPILRFSKSKSIKLRLARAYRFFRSENK